MRLVLHVHSRWSYDGHWRLEQLARFYGRLGIDAVLMTEHDTGFDPAAFGAYRAACAAASTARCRLIPGIEYSSPDNRIHLLTWGLEQFLAAHRPVAETLAAVAQAGGVAVFAHPARKAAFAEFDPAWIPRLAGIELWNRKADGWSWGPEAAALIASSGLPALLGQDFHRLKQLSPLTMRAPDPPAALAVGRDGRPDLEAHILASLRAGQLTPEVFRRPLAWRDGRPDAPLYPRLERLRRALRDRLRRRS